MRGRPPKIPNKSLADELSRELAARGWSMRRLAFEANLHVSTVTRSIKEGSFTDSVRSALLIVLGKGGGKNEMANKLQKALRLFDHSNKIRSLAEIALREALDCANLSE
jgi:IS30 family transposase